MPSTREPTPDQLDRFTATLGSAPLTYEAGLLDRVDQLDQLPRAFPRGWFIDRHRAVIGHGPADFIAACEGFRQWRQFGDDWLAVGATKSPLNVASEVGYAARVLGVWWSYGCRLLQVIDEPRQFGFVYGTVGGHAERGEERFLIELDDHDDVVYSLFAISRPGRWFSWPGIPIARLAQAKFRRRSTVTMTEFITEQRETQA